MPLSLLFLPLIFTLCVVFKDVSFMPQFQRGVRILTPPIEALFPYTLSEKFPYPEKQEFKTLLVERVNIHYTDGRTMVEVEFPKTMRSFSKAQGPAHLRRFDAGMRLPCKGAARGTDVEENALNFHLEYDIDKHVINGYVDYYPSPEATHVDFIELEYAILFSPTKD
jgi:hypothetical protein